MRKIAVICGPQLGHVGRLYEILSRLMDMSPVDITLIVPRDAHYVTTVFGEGVKTVVVPIAKDAEPRRHEIFADALREIFAENRFDLVVQDIGALKFLPLVDFPPCPRAVVTNVFIAHPTVVETSEGMNFAEVEAEVNRKRAQRGLPALGSLLDLYRADRVLLADPSPIVRAFVDLPANFVACGAASWTLAGRLPPELEDRQDLLVMSMGTTGRVNFRPNQIEKARVRAGCSHSVYVGSKFERMRRRGVAEFQYEWLPLDALLERTKIVLSQGGTGSTYQALSKGIPVIALPKHYNQDRLGRILEDLGVGLCVGEDDQIGPRLNAVDFDALARNAKGFAADMARENGAEKMAKEIEGLL